MTVQEFQSQMERLETSMASSFIENHLREGFSKEHVMGCFRSPRRGYLHDIYRELGPAQVSRLIDEVQGRVRAPLKARA